MHLSIIIKIILLVSILLLDGRKFFVQGICNNSFHVNLNVSLTVQLRPSRYYNGTPFESSNLKIDI